MQCRRLNQSTRLSLTQDGEALTRVCVIDFATNIITPSTILLGHSLESDLRPPQFVHPHCIDTALIFHHPCRPLQKPGLASGLAAQYRIVGPAGTT